MHTKLIEAVQERRVIPFIGAGFSANLSLPTWDEVVSLIADRLGWSPDVIKTQGDNYQIAEYYALERGGLSDLAADLLLKFHPPSINILDSRVHTLLVELDPPIIYTTNWDLWIERAFEQHGKKVQVVRTLADITRLQDGPTQIVKYHGDFRGRTEDIVFTESSYFKRLDFELPLDIKLRSDILGKVVLFLGYSFRDINIRLMWYKMMRLLDELAAATRDDYPRSYIVSPVPNQLQERLFRHKLIEVITPNDPDPRTGLENFLQSLVSAVV